MSCIFCEIVENHSKAHIIWEDEKHLAFLSIFPNTPGFSVVIPKKHYSSYIFEQEESVITGLTLASQKVAKLIDHAFEDVGRTGMMFEGFGVNHLHSKLFPMHGTARLKKWEKISSPVSKFFEQYEGYISSHDSERASEEDLSALATHIRSKAQSM